MKDQGRIAVYAGTFDPITNGHLWMIRHGMKMFEKLIVAIGVNPQKQTLLSVEERMELIDQSIEQSDQVRIDQFTNQYLINYAESVGAEFILRGIRNETDFRYEYSMCNINREIGPAITTVFLSPPFEVVEISSSMVKGLVGPTGWESVVANYVPHSVLQKLKEKHYGKR